MIQARDSYTGPNEEASAEVSINYAVISGVEMPDILDDVLQETLATRRTRFASILNFTAEALWGVLTPAQRLTFLRDETRRSSIIAIGIAALRHTA